MKYSQTIGVVAALLLIICCYLPWSYIYSQQVTVTGVNAAVLTFGRPALTNIFVSSLMILFFLVPKIWAKRVNVFLGAINLAWSIRNYIVVSTCVFGECPEKKPALYALVLLAVATQLMSFFPQIPIKEKE